VASVGTATIDVIPRHKSAGSITAEQYETLMRPLNGSRVAKRTQGGKQLSYLEAWDVKAHLTRVFGFGNWDLEMLDYHYVASREYESDKNKPMVEVIYSARMQLTIRDPQGRTVCRHSEAAVGSASGPATMLGEHHDNAVKQAASDALKRCAINMGSQFGLSLYDNGSTREVIRGTVVKPDGVPDKKQPTAEQAQALASSVGASGEPKPGDDEQHDAAVQTVEEQLGAEKVSQ
jgi:recombination DNA repair RAD52 pathway protein